MRDKQQQLKIELLSQWKLEAESRNFRGNTHNAGDYHALKRSHPLGVELVDVVAEAKLPVPIVAPPIHLFTSSH